MNNIQSDDNELSDEEHERHMNLGGHAGLQMTKLTDEDLGAMFESLAARLDPALTWDTNQQAEALREAGYTDDQIADFLEENAPF